MKDYKKANNKLKQTAKDFKNSDKKSKKSEYLKKFKKESKENKENKRVTKIDAKKIKKEEPLLYYFAISLGIFLGISIQLLIFWLLTLVLNQPFTWGLAAFTLIFYRVVKFVSNIRIKVI